MKRINKQKIIRIVAMIACFLIIGSLASCVPLSDSQGNSETTAQNTEILNPGSQDTNISEDPLWQDEDLLSEGDMGQSQDTESYLGGAELTLLAPMDGGQNLSCLIQTKEGSLIMVDGGTGNDTQHLIDVIQSKGGKVSAWLITHPHSDHIGALTEILSMETEPIEIADIYYSFLETEYYQAGEHQGRMDNLLNILKAFEKVNPEKLHTPLVQGQTIQVDEVTIHVMNEPYACEQNTFNNSSVGFRLDLNGKRILFLGDMGWQAGENLLQVCSPEDLKADVVQMSHHGQDGVEYDVYQTIAPEICLWPTPDWLWYNEKDGVKEAGSFKTPIVKGWMRSLGVKRNLCVKDGDQILR